MCRIRRRLTGSRLCVRSYASISNHSHMLPPGQLTEIALMLGSSTRPPERAIAPVRLPASRHRPVHDVAKTMVAQCFLGALRQAIPKLSLLENDGSQKECKKNVLRRWMAGESPQ
jgi:hypothetical protein